ncbi:MAG TPA: rod shape-determining protein MreC, partial [Anaerolineae bacterium]|nr:rod shape-determining protein MreC [Anaerolineae bacterium]
GVSLGFVPVQYAVQSLIRGLVGITQIPHDLQTLRGENQRLQQQVGELTYRLSLQREIEIENANLRELLNLKDQTPEIFGPQADLLAAEVIGRDPSNLLHFLTIDRGSQDRVEPGMAVITARGLVGQIAEVRPTSATVRLLTDSTSNVSALVQRSRATGVVRGMQEATGTTLVMGLMAQTDGIAQQGDLVLTSGLGGNFPRRLLIGEIDEVRRRDVDMFQEATLRPAVDFGRLEMVIVVRYFTPIGVDAPGPTVAP